MYENFGCEFLDLGTVQDFNSHKNEDIYFLTLDLVETILDFNYINKLLNTPIEYEYILNLKKDISINGLKEHGTIVISSNQIKLQDGNHRFIACKELYYKKFPVKIEYTDGKIQNGSKLQTFLSLIMERYIL